MSQQSFRNLSPSFISAWAQRLQRNGRHFCHPECSSFVWLSSHKQAYKKGGPQHHTRQSPILCVSRRVIHYPSHFGSSRAVHPVLLRDELPIVIPSFQALVYHRRCSSSRIYPTWQALPTKDALPAPLMEPVPKALVADPLSAGRRQSMRSSVAVIVVRKTISRSGFVRVGWLPKPSGHPCKHFCRVRSVSERSRHYPRQSWPGHQLWLSWVFSWRIPTRRPRRRLFQPSWPSCFLFVWPV